MTEEQPNVLHVADHRLAPDNRPSWCQAAGIGVFRIRPGAIFDPHLHDSTEYWLIYEGKARISVGGQGTCTRTNGIARVIRSPSSRCLQISRPRVARACSASDGGRALASQG